MSSAHGRIGSCLLALSLLGCAEGGSFWVAIEFPDQAARELTRQVWLVIVSPESAAAVCGPLQAGEIRPGAADYPIESELEIGYPPEAALPALEASGPGRRLFFAEARNNAGQALLRGCTEAEGGGGGASRVVIALAWLEEPCPQDGGCPDGDGGDGEGEDGDGGGEGAQDGDDGGDGDGDGEDGDDGADGDEGSPDGPCEPACSVGTYCDPGEERCLPCEDSAHCGEDCTACDTQAGEACQNLGPVGFCCLGPCGFPSACQRLECGETTFLCTPDFGPVSYAWQALDQVQPPVYCPLSDQDGILPERRCEQNGRDLLFNCPWDGLCQADGSCALNPAIQRLHDCGASFGCEDGRCRLHKAPGETCLFNWDCESFCCSRAADAACLPAGTDELQCKIREARFYRAADRRCFLAVSPDIAQWYSTSSQEDCYGACTGDADCDSGTCDNSYLTDWNDRCVLDSCLDEGDDQAMQGSYFCPTGDSGAHITSVTNGAPEPTEPENCTYD